MLGCVVSCDKLIVHMFDFTSQLVIVIYNQAKLRSSCTSALCTSFFVSVSLLLYH